MAVAGVEEETELTGRWNDTRIVQYLKPVPDTTETPVTDTVSDATDEDMFVSGSAGAPSQLPTASCRMATGTILAGIQAGNQPEFSIASMHP